MSDFSETYLGNDLMTLGTLRNFRLESTAQHLHHFHVLVKLSDAYFHIFQVSGNLGNQWKTTESRNIISQITDGQHDALADLAEGVRRCETPFGGLRSNPLGPTWHPYEAV